MEIINKFRIKLDECAAKSLCFNKFCRGRVLNVSYDYVYIIDKETLDELIEMFAENGMLGNMHFIKRLN